MARRKGQVSRFFAGALLVLLIVGLAGFGATNFGSRVSSIGRVGKVEIEASRYARALNQELRALEAQTGRNIPLAQAREFGIDLLVLRRLVTAAALEDEARRIGLSVGDGEVQRQILETRAFRGLDGSFDRAAYEFALDRIGLSPAEYERGLRAETASGLLQAAVGRGFAVPETFIRVIIDHVGERRSFARIVLDAGALEGPLPEPTEEDLRAWFDSRGEDFMLPPMKRLTYVWLTPEELIDEIAPDEAALRALYDSRAAQYNRPERRLVERLIFTTAEEAQAARAAIDSGEASFEEIVAGRGLSLSDIDLGDVTREELGDAAEAVFSLPEPGIVGPLETELGPALFRINAVLAPQETPFEEVRDALRRELAADAARRQLLERIPELEDLLAGGATLEELAAETGMRLGRIDWVDGQTETGIAAHAAFAEAARATEAGDYPEILELDDGGIFALRLDEALPARPDSFENARDRVARAWREEARDRRLRAEGEALLARLEPGRPLSSLGLPVTVETRRLRTAFIEDAPPGMMERVFTLAPGESALIAGPGRVALVQLNEILPPDRSDPDLRAAEAALRAEVRQGLGQDALNAFAAALEQDAGITLDQGAINAVHAQFP